MIDPQPGDLVLSIAWGDIYRLEKPDRDGYWTATLVQAGEGSKAAKHGYITPTGAGWIRVDAKGNRLPSRA